MPRKITTEVCIEDFKKVHGDTYDYTLVDYVNAKTKVTIICKDHGDFEQTYSNHFRGNGCPKCAVEKRSLQLKSNTKDFIEKANKIHGDEYKYSKVYYVNAKTKVTIICKDHGDFYIYPHQHLRGNGCHKCALEKRSRGLKSNTKDFIEKAIKVHGNTYDYTLVDYVNAKIKVTIICKEHGWSEQLPHVHLSGYGCPDCAKNAFKVNNTMNTEQFIKKHEKYTDISMNTH